MVRLGLRLRRRLRVRARVRVTVVAVVVAAAVARALVEAEGFEALLTQRPRHPIVDAAALRLRHRPSRLRLAPG